MARGDLTRCVSSSEPPPALADKHPTLGTNANCYAPYHECPCDRHPCHVTSGTMDHNHPTQVPQLQPCDCTLACPQRATKLTTTTQCEIATSPKLAISSTTQRKIVTSPELTISSTTYREAAVSPWILIHPPNMNRLHHQSPHP